MQKLRGVWGEMGSRSCASYSRLTSLLSKRLAKLTDGHFISTRSFFNFLFWTYREEALRNFFHFKPETKVIEIIYFLMFAFFCFSDETVRYAAILCLTKTHNRDREPKNQWPLRKNVDFERLLLVQLPRCEFDDLEEKKIVNLLSDEEPKNQRPFRKTWILKDFC